MTCGGTGRQKVLGREQGLGLRRRPFLCLIVTGDDTD